MSDIIVGLYEDWLWLDERIDSTTNEIELISRCEDNCQRLMSIPGIGPMISTDAVEKVEELLADGSRVPVGPLEDRLNPT